MKQWSIAGLAGIGTLVALLGISSLLISLAPSGEGEARRHVEQWRIATEAGDWQAVWSLLGPPSSKQEPHSWRPNYREDLHGFVYERHASYPNLRRRVWLQGLHRMTNVDDPYTFMAMVCIDYVDTQERVVRTRDGLFFYLTKRDGKIGIWGFNTRNW